MPTIFNLKKQSQCQHKGEKLIKLLDFNVNCETTVEVCADCNKELTKPKTDCR